MRWKSICILGALLASTHAAATLHEGDPAPAFTTQATLAGNEFAFSLAEALKKGPVVLYFYPAAFTSGCTAEAHDFAEATERFKELGATVIGVSHDSIGTLKRFSVSECRNKFAVASDANGHIMKAYDAVLAGHPEYADRISYVIAPSGTILYAYKDEDHSKHVENTLSAVRKWARSKGS